MGSKINVARIDVGTSNGEEMLAKYGIHGVPAFVLLDGKGNVIHRQVGGPPNVGEMEQKLAALR